LPIFCGKKKLKLPEMETLGGKLRNERELRGLSLDELAASTRIQKKFLQALEEGRFDALQAPVFVVGFIRTYADALGLNPNPLVAEYEALRQTLNPATPPRVLARRRDKSEWLPLTIGSAVVLVILLAAIPLLKSSKPTVNKPAPAVDDETLARNQPAAGKDDGKTGPSPESAPAQATTPPLPEPQTTEEKVRAEKSVQPSEEKAAPAPEIAKEPQQPKERVRSQPTPAPAPISSPRQNPVGQTYAYHIALSAKNEDVWIYAVVDDTDVRDMYIRAGKSVVIQGNKSFSLTTGNPLHLAVKVNGKPTPIPGALANKVIRNWLLPLDGR
jgi:cytoskeleton protein RodZ